MEEAMIRYKTIDRLIYHEGIKIQAVDAHVDMMLIILNTGAVLQEKISKYPALAHADKEALLSYEIIGNGTGIHWPSLDEDLSLKGFLGDTLRNQIISHQVA